MSNDDSDSEQDKQFFVAEEDLESEESSDEDDDVDAEDLDDEDRDEAVIDWKLLDNQKSVAPERFPFIANSGTKVLHGELDVLQYFYTFFDDYICNLLVVETNRYAKQQATTSQSSAWKPVTKEEILCFLAVIILQGVIKKPTEEMYWTRREIISTPFFAKIFNYKRYKEIKKNFHINNNEDVDENHPCPKLNKIWPVLEYVNKKFSEVYVPERDISIDESLMLYKGRLSWKQYIPTKRSRFGVKFYSLCESKSGYVYSTMVYTGKGTLLNKNYAEYPISSQIVLTLVSPLLDKGYCLTTDNFYTNPHLAEILVEHKTDTYGTVRQNRKGLPYELQKQKLKKGESISFQKGKIMVLKWKDKKDVTLLSTIHNNHFQATNKVDKVGNIIKKPNVVIDYNDTMGGVDKMDQYIHDYAITRKRGKKYYKKIFFQILDMCIFNAFVLYKKNSGLKNNIEFRMTLVERLTESKAQTSSSTAKRGRPSGGPAPTRLLGRHFPDYCPPTEKKKNPCRICVVCSKNKKRKETRYFCKDCNVALCVVPCFEVYHTKTNF